MTRTCRQLAMSVLVCAGAAATHGGPPAPPTSPLLPPFDFKLSRGLSAHGYGTFRLSVVDDGSAGDYGGLFTYNAPFAHRWTATAEGARRFLHSALLNSTGRVTAVPLRAPGGAEHVVEVTLPPPGEGVTGVLIGDPCTEPGFVGCIHFNASLGPNATMKDRLPRLVNALADADFRAVLGDNFYDQDGGITERFFSRLSSSARAVWQPTVPGNHDFWKDGAAVARSKADQYGNGFTQYYGQDVLAGKADPSHAPLDLSVDPDDHGNLPPASDFFFYNLLGNVGFIGYSGAHSADSQHAAFVEACASFNTDPQPAVIYLLGHWSAPGLGCGLGSDTASVFSRLSKLPGCNRGTLRFAMGHTHCNEPRSHPLEKGGGGGSGGVGAAAPPVGFLLGGAGVRGDFMGCNTFGFAWVSTKAARERVVGFELATPGAGTDRFDDAVRCFETKGVEQCLEYGTVWRNMSLAA